MREIKLTKGKFSLVDDEDFERESVHNWFALYNPSNDSFYAVRNKKLSDSSGSGIIYLHRSIMSPPKGLQVDHINHNTLDNRKENLRICTNLQNSTNRRKHRDNKSGYKGVHWSNYYRKWVARIMVKGKIMHIGYFHKDDLLLAIEAYNKKELEINKEFSIQSTLRELENDLS